MAKEVKILNSGRIATRFRVSKIAIAFDDELSHMLFSLMTEVCLNPFRNPDEESETYFYHYVTKLSHVDHGKEIILLLEYIVMDGVNDHHVIISGRSRRSHITNVYQVIPIAITYSIDKELIKISLKS